MGSTNGLGAGTEKNNENLKFGGVGKEAKLDQDEVMEGDECDYSALHDINKKLI